MMSCTKFAIFLLAIYQINSLRLFMIGGHAYQQSALYDDLAAAVPNRDPKPYNCLQDWKTTNCPKVAVITSSHETEAEGNATYSQDDETSLSYQHIFNKFGMSPRHISIHADNYQQAGDSSTNKGQMNLQIIKLADIFYFTGGDQCKHARAWLNDDGSQSQFLAIIRSRAFADQVIVSGSSAGSMIYDASTYGYGSPYGAIYFANQFGLAPKKILDASVNGSNLSDMRNGTNCIQYDDNAGKMPGFSWIQVIFDTHFHARGRIGRITAVMNDLKRTIGIGLDQNTSFFYQNGEGKVFGQNAVTIFDLSEAIKPESKYFQMKNVKVHYLTEGDRYDFKKKIVTSSKPLITNPQFKNATDSEDIFGEYEGSLLLTRLIDQSAVLNRGRASIPQGYPDDAPVFQLTFSKGVQTKGYRRDEAYTVANAILDYSYTTARQIKQLQLQVQ